MITLIAEELSLRWHQVKNTLELLDNDNTVPFIARYRKEVTGSLDEDQIRAIEERSKYVRTLEERKQAVLKSIDEQGKLTPELAAHINAAIKLQEVEDLYLPYKPKRRTRAMIAREKGLEPLAQRMLRQDIEQGDPLEIAAEYVDEGKGVLSAKEALAGARDIVAEIVSDDAQIRRMIRESSFSAGVLKSAAKDENNPGNYELYKEFGEAVKSVPPHRILAINRGEREDFLKVWIDVSEPEMALAIEGQYITNTRSVFTDELRAAIVDAYHRLIAPAIERDIRGELRERADLHAIRVFGANLRALLMGSPLRGKKIMGIDPGFRTGCKVAVIDETGKYLEGETIFPHEPQKRWQEAAEILAELIQDYQVEIVAIGNGTASRETEKLVAEVLSKSKSDVYYAIVNEAGASVYSASPVAKKEFPELEASQRGNISIARRLLDPLSELVKIDPKSIGVGLYQHDVDQVRLAESLDQTVESCVNQVGVNLNTASASLLKYVSGINSRVAENIVRFREEHGAFHNREQLQEVKGLGDNAFVQSAGFLRIPDAEDFLDATAVHPESYEATRRLLAELNLDMKRVRADGRLINRQMQANKKTVDHLSERCGCGRETLMDIIACLEKPDRDPRDDMPKPILRSDVLSIDDLSVGMVLKGTVRNVVDFGAFVDIGVKEDGLVHLSRMAKKYVKNPLEVVAVGDVIEVKVISIDKERHRIGLSMVLDA
jgi:protein Tex